MSDDRLPTLKGLQAFEATYKFKSFTDAANSLNVQQPAISYQIRNLENDLGTRLFEKQGARLRPTDKADLLYNTLSSAFNSIRDVCAYIKSAETENTTTIATYSGIATYWLSPRIETLSANLGVGIRVVTLDRDSDLFSENADCWIAFGSGRWKGFDSKMLMPEEVCPVAAPALVEKYGNISEDEFLQKVTKIEQEDVEGRWLNWTNWQQTNPSGEKLSGPKISVINHGLALHMALSGAGVTLGWLGMIQGLIDSKSLVQVSEKTIRSDAGYWVLGKAGFFETEKGAAIYRGLLEQSDQEF